MCTTEQIAILYHEAGHAIVGHSVGIKIVKITIDKSNETWSGKTFPDIDKWNENNHTQCAMYFLAGGESELIYNPNRNILFTGENDDEKARKYILRQLGFPEMTTLLSSDQLDKFENTCDELRLSVRDCLSKNWKIIENIATELIASDELKDNELLGILSAVQ